VPLCGDTLGLEVSVQQRMLYRALHYRTLLGEGLQFQHLESHRDGYVLIQEVLKQA
jgi:hypothetical protein